MRTIVSPVFTSGKLKLMIPHIDKCGDNMADMLNTAAISGEILEAKDMYGKFTLDSIATSGFGIESNSYKDPENQFRVNAMKLTRSVQLTLTIKNIFMDDRNFLGTQSMLPTKIY